MKFRSLYQTDDPYQRVDAPVGSRFMDKFQVEIDDSGNRFLVKTGETNLFELIQSFRDEVDFKSLLDRCTRTGDFSPLEQVQGSYFDGAVYPQDLRALYDLDREARRIYESSEEVRNRFSSYQEALQAFATDEGVKSFFGSLKGSTASVEPSTAASDES